MLAFIEIIRVLFILIFGTGLLVTLEVWLYGLLDIALLENSLGWMIAFANLIIVFVVYRNNLQFKGWFKSSRSSKLPKLITRTLLVLAMVLIILPLIKG
ncbi:hypothetical protein [Alkaliphilus transvaalensis]|uniref:hypothetical protein n=1 Tax=Alkaliphilus transvaalensis TaxID=114628 RepID=UPI00047B75FE|nr:hypothetical protein [Alkaliphilus transvaalensis]